ncbi:MAG: cation:proton antiporter [Sporichthyaceae bacterium]
MGSTVMAAAGPDYALVFLDVAVIIVAARAGGALFRRIGQPAVLGEILAGIALGPTLLGSLPGDLDQRLFPQDAQTLLNVLAKFGLILFMFIVGLEVDFALVRDRARSAVAISVSSVALPFGLGVLLTFLLHNNHDTVDGEPVRFIALALFIGVAMSITAFPVLARILTERGMHRTPTGVLALACAAVDDVIAWSLLAVVVAIANEGDPWAVVLIVVETAAFAAVLFIVVRPLLGRLVVSHERAGRLTPNALAVILVGILLSAWITDRIGVHEIFGAFLFGAAMPRIGARKLAHEIMAQIEHLALLLLLPVFFVVAGLGVDVRSLRGEDLIELTLVVLVAISGKFFGAYGAARTQRIPKRQAGALAVLMNTRGLTELVVLKIGKDAGVLDQDLYTILVIMAVLTTAMTGPLLRRVYPDRLVEREIAAAERAELDEVPAYKVLVDLSNAPPDAEAMARNLVALACDLTGDQRPAVLVLSSVLPSPGTGLEVGAGMSAGVAALVESGAALRRRGEEVSARGVSASIVSRFGDPAPAELPAQGTQLGVDLIISAQDWAPQAAAATIAVVRGEVTAGSGPPVLAVTDGGTDSAAALRLAVAVARARDSELLLWATEGGRTRRQAQRLASTLSANDLPTRVVEAAQGALLIAPAGPWASATHDGQTVLEVTASTNEFEVDEVTAQLTEA